MRSIIGFSILFAFAALVGCTPEEAVERSMLRIGAAKRGEFVTSAGSSRTVLYIEKPELYVASTEGILFKLDSDERYATQVKVQYGEIAGGLVEVRSGLQPGAKVILSD